MAVRDRLKRLGEGDDVTHEQETGPEETLPTQGDGQEEVQPDATPDPSYEEQQAQQAEEGREPPHTPDDAGE
jgi:hypothetical protein